MKKKIFTFGEIMLRISPYNQGERVEGANVFRIEPGGSESNVAVALARLGHGVAFLSKLPDNMHKNLILRYFRQYNVDPSYMAIGGERMGVYWTETGIGPRATDVLYDRGDTSFSNLDISDFNWEAIKKDTHWFHTSGITPAISENSHRNICSILDNFAKDITVSIDINYRNKLWRWIQKKDKKKIHEIMNKLCSHAYLITGNESDFQDGLGCSITKICEVESYKKVVEELFESMPKLHFIAISLRTCYSASTNDWSGVLFVRNGNAIKIFEGPKYRLDNIVDRVGTGDSFTGGIIHGILKFEDNFQRIVDFATTLSALNHTVCGDASQFAQRDVERVMECKESGRIIR